MSINNGTTYGIYFAGTLIANATSNDIDFQLALFDASTKDSNGHKESLGGQKSWSASVDVMMDDAAGYGYTDLWNIQQSRLTVAIVYSNKNTGDFEYGGESFITGLPRNAPLEESETFTATLEGTGAPAETAVP